MRIALGLAGQPVPGAAAGLPPWQDLPTQGAARGTAARQAVLDAQRPHFAQQNINVDDNTVILNRDQVLDELFRVHPGGVIRGATRAFTRLEIERAFDSGQGYYRRNTQAGRALERATAHIPRYARNVSVGSGRPDDEATGSGQPGKAAHLVKGSEAAKKHMADLRAKRGQKRGL
jgi:hypothetical protein